MKKLWSFLRWTFKIGWECVAGRWQVDDTRGVITHYVYVWYDHHTMTYREVFEPWKDFKML